MTCNYCDIFKDEDTPPINQVLRVLDEAVGMCMKINEGSSLKDYNLLAANIESVVSTLVVMSDNILKN